MANMVDCMLLCFIILTQFPFSTTLKDKPDDDGFKILSVKEYSEMYLKDRSPRKGVFQCDFNSGFCGFGMGSGNFKWTLWRGSTRSLGTGPSDDMSGKGLYAYIETSYPRRYGDKAILATPSLPAMVYCLQFGFHAYGADIGALLVYMRYSKQRKNLVKLTKSFGNKWQYVVGTISSPNNFKIEFTGVCGRSYRGDIALDNIIITTGTCSQNSRRGSSCGVGYPSTSLGLASFPQYRNWPWWVGLSHSGKKNALCSGVCVSDDWLLTSKYCVEKFAGKRITTRAGNSDSTGRWVIKIHQNPSKIFGAVLLQLNKPATKKITDKVCLPPSMSGLRREKCYLLATSFSTSGKLIEETAVTIIPFEKCVSSLKLTPWKHQDRRRLLCIQADPGHPVNHGQTERDGFVVCKNDVLRRWILHAMGSFSYSNLTTRPVIFTKVSSIVNWVEQKRNTSTTKPPPGLASVIVPKVPKAPTKGFQIFEQTKEKCLTYVSRTRRFTYQSCDIYNILQRFLMSSRHQIIVLKTNQCLTITSDGRGYHLRATRCQATRRSQKWTCVGSTMFNNFHTTLFINFASENNGFVRVSEKRRGRFLVYGTEDNVCSVQRTVKGIFRCRRGRGSMCGFANLHSNAQFEWTFLAARSRDTKAYPSLLYSERFFKVRRRGPYGAPAPVMTSPLFSGQRCLQLRTYVRGSSRDKLTVYKYERSRRRNLLQITGDQFRYDRHWTYNRVTITSRQCESYRIFFEALVETGSLAKFALRNIKVSPGPCEYQSKSTDGKCLKGWTFLNGSCFYAYDIQTTWHQALKVCRITGAELSTDHAVNGFIRAGTTTWSGIRSCPNGELQSSNASILSLKGVPSAKGTCLQLHTPIAKKPIFTPRSCKLKSSFICQNDPVQAGKSCGLKNTTGIAADRQWPWHVIILRSKRCMCAGTLVAPGYVVTSTLCVSGIRPAYVKIFIPSSRTIIHKVTKIVRHSNSRDGIAIIMFEDEVLSRPSIRFACVNKMTNIWKQKKSSGNQLLKGATCLVLGWDIEKGGRASCGPRNYRVHEVEIVEKELCKKYYGAHMITEHVLCARLRWLKTLRRCHSHTGGPLICDIAGAWTLVGVTRWGAGCTETRKYGIYTDVASMVPWMEE